MHQSGIQFFEFEKFVEPLHVESQEPASTLYFLDVIAGQAAIFHLSQFPMELAA